MKKTALLLLATIGLSVFLVYGINHFNALQLLPRHEKVCPKEGSARPGKKPLSDKQKKFNRKKNLSSAVPNENPEVIAFKDLLHGTGAVNDSADWNEGAYVEIGNIYLIDYKQQKGESCNCYYADEDAKTWGDIHINIGTKEIMDEANNNYYMIVEITPSYKILQPDYLSNLKSLKGKKVTIRGYLFYDREHERNSINYCKSCTDKGVWRKSCWEIHPVTYIGGSN